MRTFDPKELEKIHKRTDTSKNGQVVIIGGSDLFHGAPILALKIASRIVDMVYFSSPEPSVGKVAENLKSKLGSFIWVPWDEVGDYIQKSDAVLVGPGMKRWHKESSPPKADQILAEKFLDKAGRQTRTITEKFLKKFPQKQWVIDAGALQVMDVSWIPKNAILTPNKKEFEMLFKFQSANWRTKFKIEELVAKKAKEHDCIIVLKGKATTVCSRKECVVVTGGNPGLAKGGTGDVQAGLTVALSAQNGPFLAAASSAWIIKEAADELYKHVGAFYNADDLAEEVPKIFGKFLK